MDKRNSFTSTQLFSYTAYLLSAKREFGLYLFLAWLITALTTLLFATIFLIHLSITKLMPVTNTQFNLYSALPSTQGEVSSTIEFRDSRAKIVENFFNSYSSPLAYYSDVFVKAADQYHIDYRLMPAISMQESNGGKKIIDNSYNPFGFGIYDNQVVKFSSWEEGIWKVAKTLRESYFNNGLNSPQKIMVKYTPPSTASGGSWARGVSFFMEELK